MRVHEHLSISNPLLVMAQIKLIEFLRRTKRTTIRYKGPKIRLFNETTAIAKTNGRFFPTKKETFKPFCFEGSSKLVLSFKCRWNLIFSFLACKWDMVPLMVLSSLEVRLSCIERGIGMLSLYSVT